LAIVIVVIASIFPDVVNSILPDVTKKLPAADMTIIIFLLGYLIFSNKIPGLDKRDRKVVKKAAEEAIRYVHQTHVIGSILKNRQDLYESAPRIIGQTEGSIYSVVHGTSVFREMEKFREDYREAALKRLDEMPELVLRAFVVLDFDDETVDESVFQQLLDNENKYRAKFQDRLRIYVVEGSFGFDYSVYDTKHWAMFFASNPAAYKPWGILFENEPEAARRIENFIRERWVETRVAMRVSDARARFLAHRRARSNRTKSQGPRAG